MKKKMMVIVASMLFLLAACGEDNTAKKIEGDVTNQVQEKENKEEKETENTVESKEEKADSYVFDYSGVKITIGAEAEEILSAMGKPLSKYESPSCAFGDLDVMYTYSGVEVDTYQVEGVDYISCIILLDDSQTTPEGLCLGDDASKVTELYGEADFTENGNPIYQGKDMKLVIILEDGKVSSIEYLNTLF